jgi:hypothetical protein
LSDDGLAMSASHRRSFRIENGRLISGTLRDYCMLRLA